MLLPVLLVVLGAPSSRTPDWDLPLRGSVEQAQSIVLARVLSSESGPTGWFQRSMLVDVEVHQVLRSPGLSSPVRVRAPTANSDFMLGHQADLGELRLLFLDPVDDAGFYPLISVYDAEAIPWVLSLMTIQSLEDAERREAASIDWLLLLLDDPDRWWVAVTDLHDNARHRPRSWRDRPWGSDLWAAMTTEQRCRVVELLFTDTTDTWLAWFDDPDREWALRFARRQSNRWLRRVSELVATEPDHRISQRLLDLVVSHADQAGSGADFDLETHMLSLARRLEDERLARLAASYDMSRYWALRGYKTIDKLVFEDDPTLVELFVERAQELIAAGD